MPVAGEDAVSAAALRERPFHQRVALVRAEVVAGEDAAGAGDNRDLLAAGLEAVTSLFHQLAERRNTHQRGARCAGQGHGNSPSWYFLKYFLANSISLPLAFPNKKL